TVLHKTTHDERTAGSGRLEGPGGDEGGQEPRQRVLRVAVLVEARQDEAGVELGADRHRPAVALLGPPVPRLAVVQPDVHRSPPAAVTGRSGSAPPPADRPSPRRPASARPACRSPSTARGHDT